MVAATDKFVMMGLRATFPKMHILFHIGYRKLLMVLSGSMNRKVTKWLDLILLI
jgi:hypothetical protein